MIQIFKRNVHKNILLAALNVMTSLPVCTIATNRQEQWKLTLLQQRTDRRLLVRHRESFGCYCTVESPIYESCELGMCETRYTGKGWSEFVPSSYGLGYEVFAASLQRKNKLIGMAREGSAATSLVSWPKTCPAQLRLSLTRAYSISVHRINNNNNIYRGSPTRQGGFQWGPHALI